MSEANPPAVGSIGWKDLTVDDAERVRDFYMAVAGWTAQPIDMGGYNDYVMMPAGGGEPVGGHLPPPRRQRRHSGSVAALHRRG